MTKRKPSRTNHQKIILKKKKKLNNLYNYTPFAFKTPTFAWDDSVVFFQGNINGPRRNAQVSDLIPQEILFFFLF